MKISKKKKQKNKFNLAKNKLKIKNNLNKSLKNNKNNSNQILKLIKAYNQLKNQME